MSLNPLAPFTLKGNFAMPWYVISVIFADTSTTKYFCPLPVPVQNGDLKFPSIYCKPLVALNGYHESLSNKRQKLRHRDPRHTQSCKMQVPGGP